ncbi:outer membrane beta-barrel protein [Pedobacter sp. KR3-3]|uniref:Outer membrane beta-barrel protein n=1 Tax=Pedobacter albus TaxID=3113905 RepID=A0ABU7I8V6_9SPHI|nr:outer membrane beta-barrel protein [Pedobacter sp. KR3-3]MEE1945802.1 outer membrane beta-barrel protein [Pedobacter sp. KR3-3]
MRLANVLVLAILLAFTSHFCVAQQAKPTAPGSVKGILRDTVHKYVVKTATISVYREKDSTLLNYQLSNNYGEFNVKNLPVGMPLRLEVSHLGYTTLDQRFTIPASTNMHDFGTLILKVRDITLKEVVVKVPPISMNGDTLEINPAAFKLDSNAVIEDVLRRTPGVTLWGDGAITVNGKPVKSVFVDGKEFFGDDPKIALQNISKQAIQKVQVYNQKNEQNPLDSNLIMNLKLKASKKFGMFGKIGAGVGTDKRYEADGNLNIYTAKMQLGIVGASNNVNKSAGNATTLLSNSTFKGIGANISYQPDFRSPGIAKPSAGGLVFKYDFKENPDYNKRSALSVNYFAQNRDFENQSQNESITTIANADQLYGTSDSKSHSDYTNQNFDASYQYGGKDHTFDFTQRLAKNSSKSNSQSLTSSFDNQRALVSQNAGISNSESQTTNFYFAANYRKSKYDYSPKAFRLFNSFNVSYSINTGSNQNQSNSQSDFRSFVNSSANRKIERRYDNQADNTQQNLVLELPQLTSIFKPSRFINRFRMSLKNSLKLGNTKGVNLVEDLDALTGTYKSNNYLSNRLSTNQLEEQPELNIERSFNKSLANRYSKNLRFAVALSQGIIVQDNKSTKSFQNIRKTYSRFLPNANVNYSNYQYGDFSESINISYQQSMRIPNISQLAPLTDSINAYSLRLGNLRLHEAQVHGFRISFNHTDQKKKNTFHYNASINAEMVNDGFADSLFVDAQNRQASYTVNVNGTRTLNGSLNVNKAYKLKKGEIQLRLNSSIDFSKNPGYVNGVLNFSNVLRSSNVLNIFYTLNDKVAVEAGTSFNPSRSKQKNFNTEYRGANYMTTLSASYNISKKLTLSSNINYNRNTSNNTDAINFTIWNANVTYRFFKNNSAELKLAALDMLHQNTSAIIFARANGLTTGTQTVLQQYFMTSLSYYPRIFGMPDKKK